MRSERYEYSWSARVVLPEVGRPVMIMSCMAGVTVLDLQSGGGLLKQALSGGLLAFWRLALGWRIPCQRVIMSTWSVHYWPTGPGQADVGGHWKELPLWRGD
jgi:hypothetical protein